MNKYPLNTEYVVDLIKQRVTMTAAVARYVPDTPPRHNRIPCPIHDGINPNLSFSEHLFYCHKCGVGGDVISFTQHLFGISFIDALEKLNADFQCGAPLNRRPTLREQRDAQKCRAKIIATREQNRSERTLYAELADLLWGEYIRLDRNRTEHAPESHDTEPHPLYVEAAHKIDYVNYLIDVLL